MDQKMLESIFEPMKPILNDEFGQQKNYEIRKKMLQASSFLKRKKKKEKKKKKKKKEERKQHQQHPSKLTLILTLLY